MKSKAPLLLMEQMVMLVVFALAAALCVQAFVRSDASSRRSDARDHAVVLCQNAAEVVRHTGGNFNEAAELLGLEFGQGSTMFRRYDENWQPLPISQGPVPGAGYVSEPEGTYVLSVHALLNEERPGMGKAAVSVSSEQDGVLFELEVAFQREVNPRG